MSEIPPVVFREPPPMPDWDDLDDVNRILDQKEGK